MIPKEQKNDNQPLALEENIEIAIGQQVFYKVSVHGSVGIQAKIWSENEDILKLIDKKFAYHRPMKEMRPGGDAATRTYIFEAIAEGKAEVMIQKKFRGKLESEISISVTVK